MTAHDPSLARSSGGLFGWLGLGAGRTAGRHAAAPPLQSERPEPPRLRQLEEIGSFLS
jgi:hypothetical protein